MFQRIVFLLLFVPALAVVATAQADEFCRESGSMPGLDSPFAHVPYVFGRVVLKGFDPAAKAPKVYVSLVTGQGSPERINVGSSGTYCFKRSGSGGEIVVEVDGIEAARRTLPGFGSSQIREDFEITPTHFQMSAIPAVVSAKFSHPRNEKTVELYKLTVEAEAGKDRAKAVGLLQEIVARDSDDFIAWAKLGTLYFEQEKYAEANASYRKSLELKIDYLPVWINLGKMRIAQKQYAAAIEILKHAVELDPTSARTHQLLGEVYLLDRKGTLGAEALNNAIRLDPIGMAECHLKLAHLYELAGAKPLAALEYKAFLAKVPDHPDRKKFERFIKEHAK